jgi:hypothetical protein
MINIDVNLAGTQGTAAAGIQTNQLSSLSAQSFTSLLSEALSETLSKFGIDPNSVKFTLLDQPSQTPATGQTPAAAPIPVPSQPPAASQTPIAPAKLPATAPPGVNPPPGSTSTLSADDAYWAKQPPMVQQLREIGDIDARKQLGEQLANEGYSIDVPIMVWGWDAAKVTAARESYGYTWVPSALQQPISAAPGITGGGFIPYDPTKPPSGSIQV